MSPIKIVGFIFHLVTSIKNKTPINAYVQKISYLKHSHCNVLSLSQIKQRNFSFDREQFIPYTQLPFPAQQASYLFHSVYLKLLR